MSVTFKREPLVSKPGGATGCGIVTTWKLRWPEYFQNFFPLRPSRTIAASLFPALANFRARRPHLRRWRKNSNCAKAFQLARTLAVTERTDTFPRRDAVQGLWWLLLTPAGSRKPNLFVSPRNFAVAGKRNCDGKKLGRNRSACGELAIYTRDSNALYASMSKVGNKSGSWFVRARCKLIRKLDEVKREESRIDGDGCNGVKRERRRNRASEEITGDEATSEREGNVPRRAERNAISW